MVKTVSRRRSMNPMATKLVAFLAAKSEVKEAEKRAEALKKELSEFVDQNHYTDPDKGHLLHTLPEEVDFLGQRFTGFMKQRKAPQVFLEDEATALCEEKGFDLDDYTTRYIDQDKIVRLYAEEKISKEEFDALYETNETWAFVPMKD